MRVKCHHDPTRGGPCRRPDTSGNRCRSTLSHTSSATCGPIVLVRWCRIQPLFSICALAAASIPLRVNPSRSRTAFTSAARSWWAAHNARHLCWASRCNARRNRNTVSQRRSSSRCSCLSEASSSRRITDTGPSYLKFGTFDLPRRRGPTTPESVVVSVGVAAIGDMQPHSTDNNSLPRRHRNLLPLTGLHHTQFRTVYAPAQQRPWRIPLAVRVLLVLVHIPHQPDHPGTGRAVRHQPIAARPDHSPPGAHTPNHRRTMNPQDPHTQLRVIS